MNNLIKILLTAVIVFCSFSNISAFDGNRKGFVCDLGIGFSGYQINVKGADEKYKDLNGLGVNASIGYNLKNKNSLVFETINFGNFIEKSVGAEHKMEIYSFNWYHYFKSQNKSLFTIVGVGKYISHERRSIDLDFNKFISNKFIVGAGYEFLRGVQFKFYYLFGQYSESDGNVKFYVPYLSLSYIIF